MNTEVQDSKLTPIDVQRDSEKGLIQLTDGQYDVIKENFALMKAKYLESSRKLHSLQSVLSELNWSKSEINRLKTRANQYEVAFIRAETKLTNLCVKLQEGGSSNVDWNLLMRSLDINTSKKEIVTDSVESSLNSESGIFSTVSSSTFSGLREENNRLKQQLDYLRKTSPDSTKILVVRTPQK